MKKSCARLLFSDVDILALVRLRKQRIVSLSLASFVLAVPCALVRAQMPSPALAVAVAPSLSKEQIKGLDKEGRNFYKRCSEDVPTDPVISGKTVNEHTIAKMGGISGIATACQQLSAKLDTQLHDGPAALLALRRSCALGNAAGCNALGSSLAASGDILGARAAWSAPPCGSDQTCQISLFNSYADAATPDVASAHKIGLPLCDEGGDDRICDRLQQIGVKADFNAIAIRHWNAKVAKIRDQIQVAEAGALDEDQLAAQSDELAQQAAAAAESATSSGLGVLGALSSGLAKGGAQSHRTAAQRDRDTAASLRADLDRLNAAQPAVTTTSTLSGMAVEPAQTSSPIQEAAQQGTANINAAAAQSMAITSQQNDTSAYDACEAQTFAKTQAALPSDPHAAEKATNYDPCAQYSH
jgi:hypothetical protein